MVIPEDDPSLLLRYGVNLELIEWGSGVGFRDVPSFVRHQSTLYSSIEQPFM
jgi:hypothetical protein